MATSKDSCCICFAPSIRWPGAPLCRSCFDAQAAERVAAKNRPAKVVAIGGVLDGPELLARHGERVALAEARAAEIARGRPAGAVLH